MKDLYVSIVDVTQHLLDSPVVVIKPPNKPLIMTIPMDEYETIQSAVGNFNEMKKKITKIKINND